MSEGVLRVEPLAAIHDREGFSCGAPELDRYLKTQARQDVSKNVAACFVLTADGKRISGFYTLSQYSIDPGMLPHSVVKKLPRYPTVPATLLGRLAIAQQEQGRGFGTVLLADAVKRSWRQSSEIASAFLLVDAKDEAAASFYERYEFIKLPGHNRLFLPMSTIAELMK